MVQRQGLSQDQTGPAMIDRRFMPGHAVEVSPPLRARCTAGLWDSWCIISQGGTQKVLLTRSKNALAARTMVSPPRDGLYSGLHQKKRTRIRQGILAWARHTNAHAYASTQTCTCASTMTTTLIETVIHS